MSNEYYAPVHPLPVHNFQLAEPMPEASQPALLQPALPQLTEPQLTEPQPAATRPEFAPPLGDLQPAPAQPNHDIVQPQPVTAQPQPPVAYLNGEPMRVVTHPVQGHPAIQQPLPLHTMPVEHRPVHAQAVAPGFAPPQFAGPQLQPPSQGLMPQPLQAAPQVRPQFAGPQPTMTHPRTAPYYPAPQRPNRPKNHVFAIIASALIASLFASAFTAAALTFLRPSGSGGLSIGNFSRPNQPTTLDPGRVDPAPIELGEAVMPNWQAVASEVFDSVVSIQVITAQGGSVGSGFVLDDAGHVITNAHVVSGAQNDEVQVTLADGRLFRGNIVGADSRTDLAVVRLAQPPADLHPVALGDSTTVQVGDPVLAVGNPLSLANTVTQGIVSALNRPVVASGGVGTDFVTTNAIQIDAAINPGNSGGPLFNKFGQVIGVNSSIASLSAGVFGGSGGSIGLGFAIPVNLAKQISAQLIENGEAEHAFLGVGMLSQAAIVTVDGVTRRGAQISGVTPGTPAAEAGMQVGDVVVAFNGLPVATHEALTALVGERHVGDHATITVVRDNTALEFDVVLTTRAVLDTIILEDTPAPDDEQNPGGEDTPGDPYAPDGPEDESYFWYDEDDTD